MQRSKELDNVKNALEKRGIRCGSRVQFRYYSSSQRLKCCDMCLQFSRRRDIYAEVKGSE